MQVQAVEVEVNIFGCLIFALQVDLVAAVSELAVLVGYVAETVNFEWYVRDRHSLVGVEKRRVVRVVMLVNQLRFRV